MQQVDSKFEKKMVVFLNSLINQAKKNKIELNSKAEFNIDGKTVVFSTLPEYRKFGTHQVCNWNSPVYNSNKESVVASFKLKLNGNMFGKFSVHVKHVVGDVPEQELIRLSREMKQTASTTLN